MNRLKAIACVDNNWAIGKDNKLLFHIPEDMKFFKKMTTDNVVVMGNNTFKSMNEKPLPDRINVILTSEIQYGIIFNNGFIKTEPYGLEKYIQYILKNTNKDIFFIGGESIYKRYAPMCDDIYITHVEGSAKNPDAYFPKNIINGYNHEIIDRSFSRNNGRIEYWYTMEHWFK